MVENNSHESKVCFGSIRKLCQVLLVSLGQNHRFYASSVGSKNFIAHPPNLKSKNFIPHPSSSSLSGSAEGSLQDLSNGPGSMEVSHSLQEEHFKADADAHFAISKGTCGACKKYIPIDSIFCMHCGFRVK